MAGTPGHKDLYKKLDSVIEPVILTDIKESNIQHVNSNDDVIPFEELDHIHQRLIDEYMVDLNQTQAAIRAGYSPNSASQQASDLFGRPYIQAHVNRRLAEASSRTGLNADRVIRELARISFANPARVVAADGSIVDGASEDDLAAIQSIKVKTTTSKAGTTVEREVKFYDKNKSLELAGKHIGMFIDKREVKITNNFDVTNLSTEEIRAELDKQRRISDLALNTIDITPNNG